MINPKKIKIVVANWFDFMRFVKAMTMRGKDSTSNEFNFFPLHVAKIRRPTLIPSTWILKCMTTNIQIYDLVNLLNEYKV